MEELNAPVVDPNAETNGQGTPVGTTQTAPGTKRTIFVDKAGINAILSLKANKTLQALVHPKFYAAVAQYLYNASPANRGEVDGRPTLKDGTPTDYLRRLVSKDIGYTGELAIVSESQSATITAAIENNRVMTTLFFKMARANIANGSMSEDQAKDLAFGMIDTSRGQMTGDLVIPIEALEILWLETEPEEMPV